jgi:uncharacterized protein (TIGR02453 family)
MDFSNAFVFLTDLAANNNRDWFNLNKDRFLTIKNEFDQFIEKLIPKVREIDPLLGLLEAKECVFRIYRDVRFSTNKEPYKYHLGAYIANGGRKSRFAGYYLHLQPNQSFLAAGAYLPPPEILKEIRYEIVDNTSEYLKIIKNSNFVNYFNEISGEKGKLVPKGFPKDFPYVDLIKFKSYEISCNLTNELFFSGNVEIEIINAIKAALPFNQFLNRAIQNIITGAG